MRPEILSRFVPRHVSNERGVAMAFVAVLLVVLMGLAAIAIDLGIMLTGRAEAQRSADAAAHAGAVHLMRAPTDAEGARDAAVEVAQKNLVRAGIVDIDRITDIDVRLDSSRVRARVYRTEGRNNPVGTLFARALGFNDVSISAVAAAEVFPATTARCTLPIALADRWCKSWNGTSCAQYSTLTDRWATGDYYQPWVDDTGVPKDQWEYNDDYTGWGDALRGSVMELRGGATGGGNSAGITPWWSTFVYEEEPPGGPANLIAGRVRGCDERRSQIGDGLWAGPGMMTPVMQEFVALIAEDPNAVWNQSANDGRGCVTTSGSSVCRDSPRIKPIVLFDPRNGPTGAAGSSAPFHIRNLAGVFIEAARATPANNSFLRARFVELMGEEPGPSGSVGSSLNRILRIVE